MKCNTCDGSAVLGNTDNCTDGSGCVVFGRICKNCGNLFAPTFTKRISTFYPDGYLRVSRNTTCSPECRGISASNNRKLTRLAKGLPPARTREEKNRIKLAKWHEDKKRK